MTNKKVAFWITSPRFTRMFHSFKETQGIELFFFTREPELLKRFKNVIKIPSPYSDCSNVLKTLKDNKIDMIFMSHIQPEFLTRYSGKKIFFSHGLFDNSPITRDIVAKLYIDRMNDFDKLLVPDKISTEMCVSYFGIDDNKIVPEIYLPFDSLYEVKNKNIPVEKIITIADYGFDIKDTDIGKDYDNRFFSLLSVLHEFCLNNKFNLYIKLKERKSAEIFKKDSRSKKIVSHANVKMLGTDDVEYLKKSSSLFIIRSPSMEIESLFFDIPTIIVRDKSEDFNDSIKYGACFNLPKEDINIKKVTEIMSVALKDKTIIERRKDYIKYLNINFNGTNATRLMEMIKNNKI